jgi:hypothetical protein
MSCKLSEWHPAKFSIGPSMAAIHSRQSYTGIAPSAVSSGGKTLLERKKIRILQVQVVRVSHIGSFNGIRHKRRVS